MADIEQRALGLLNESRIAFGLAETNVFFRDQTPENEALCRALQRQEPAVTSELRPAVEVWWKATDAWKEGLSPEDGTEAAAAVIEADREAVRAEQAADLAKFKALADTLAGALENALAMIGHNLTTKDAAMVDGKRLLAIDVWGSGSEALRQYKEARDAS